MKFFRKKDKRKDASQSGIPSFGLGTDVGGSGTFSGYGNAGFNPARSGPGPGRFRPMANRRSAMLLSELPPQVLKRIFGFVCPHSKDESYDTWEDSSQEFACMLCDLRDLAHCAATSKAWRQAAIGLL